MNILQQIAASKRREVEAAKSLIPVEVLREIALSVSREARSLSRSISERPVGIIAEFKRRSPSRGEIAPMAQVAEIVPAYEANGAAGSSILTDTPFFGGALTDLLVARQRVGMPLLRKEFIVDEYQILQARIAGADAILLIASLLTPGEVGKFTDIAHRHSMEVLLELHSPDEFGHICDGADMIGINNRDLTSFNTDLRHSQQMISSLPQGKVKIAESGIKNPSDIARLKDAGFDGFLIGEAFMATPSPGDTLRRFIAEAIGFNSNSDRKC